MLLGLALMHVYVSGPFWCLINSDMHYLDQFRFIQPLFFFLSEVEQHPDILLGGPEEIPHEVESFRLRAPRTPTAESVLRFRETAAAINRDLLLQVLKTMARHFRETVERQLKDFLPEGKYGQAPDDDARQRMQHCQLTNLLGEACFADLDYSRFKSRRATLHHHSTLNLGKRNHPISKWLSKKTPEEQSLLLAKARKLAPGIRAANNQKELIVLQELNEDMEEQQRIKADKARRQLQAKHKLMADIQAQGGGCKTGMEVDSLLESCSTKTEKTSAMKLQSRYYREFFGAKLPLTNLTPDQLAANLKGFLESTFPADATPLLIPGLEEEDDLAAPGELSSDTDSFNAAPGDMSSDTDSFNFLYAGQGQSVAVFYDDHFYVGQVLVVHQPDSADITFMEQKGEENVFKWPLSDTIEQVSACFVFYADFDLVERHRVWAVREPEWTTLKRRWKMFLQHAIQV